MCSDSSFSIVIYRPHLKLTFERPECGEPLSTGHGIEVGQIFNLGTKYSKSMGATFLDAGGEEKLCVMGCFGIGVTRTVSAIIEQNHDENGIIWPPGVSPYRTLILPVNITDAPSMNLTEKTYEKLLNSGMEVLLDDRNVRAGIKFKDADLIGIPVRITIGPEKAKSGIVEIKNRRTGEETDCREKDLMPELSKLSSD
jgi:prolyl-tRNA synthetase